jgi:TRAP-type C4-dicarboxylate transport system substrate-binding protein
MVVCAMACALAGAAHAQKVEKIDIIMATLAPTDSQWYKVMENMGAEWKKISNGNVNLSIRAGGVVGDTRTPSAGCGPGRSRLPL